MPSQEGRTFYGSHPRTLYDFMHICILGKFVAPRRGRRPGITTCSESAASAETDGSDSPMRTTGPDCPACADVSPRHMVRGRFDRTIAVSLSGWAGFMS